MDKNAFSCLIWIANELNRNENLIDVEERFYEKEHNDFIQPKRNETIPSEEMSKIKSLTVADLVPVTVYDTQEINDTILEKDFTDEAGENLA